MPEGLLVIAGAALLSHDEKAPPGMVFTKGVTFTILLHATEELTKGPELAFSPVRQALTEAKQASRNVILQT